MSPCRCLFDCPTVYNHIPLWKVGLHGMGFHLHDRSRIFSVGLHKFLRLKCSMMASPPGGHVKISPSPSLEASVGACQTHIEPKGVFSYAAFPFHSMFDKEVINQGCGNQNTVQTRAGYALAASEHGIPREHHSHFSYESLSAHFDIFPAVRSLAAMKSIYYDTFLTNRIKVYWGKKTVSKCHVSAT